MTAAWARFRGSVSTAEAGRAPQLLRLATDWLYQVGRVRHHMGIGGNQKFRLIFSDNKA